MKFNFHTQDALCFRYQFIEAENEEAARAEYLRRLSPAGDVVFGTEWLCDGVRHAKLKHLRCPEYSGLAYWKVNGEVEMPVIEADPSKDIRNSITL